MGMNIKAQSDLSSLNGGKEPPTLTKLKPEDVTSGFFVYNRTKIALYMRGIITSAND